MADLSPIQTELEAIREANDGILRAEDVVAWAEANPDSALHARFTWDDTQAAIKRRLDEARSVIRLVVFVAPNTTQPIRTYVSLEPDRQVKGGGYRHVGEVMGEEERRKIFLRQGLREYQRVKQKYGTYRELAVLFANAEEIEALEKEITGDTLDVAIDMAQNAPAPTAQ